MTTISDDIPRNETRPSLLTLGYSLVFAAVYWILALAIAAFVLGDPVANQSGYGIIVAYLAAYLMGWIFVRRHQRAFSNPEMTWLIVWCGLWMLISEIAAYATGWSIITYLELISSLPASWRLLGAFLGVTLNLAFLTYVLRKHVVKMMNGRIKASA